MEETLFTSTSPRLAGPLAGRWLERLNGQGSKEEPRYREVFADDTSTGARNAVIDPTAPADHLLAFLFEPGAGATTACQTTTVDTGSISSTPAAAPVGRELSILASGFRSLTEMPDSPTRRQAMTLLQGIQAILAEMDAADLPPVAAADREDGSVLLEWMGDKHRLGFSVEVAQEESSWYFVSTPDAGSIQASGRLASEDIRRLLEWFVSSARR